MKRLLIIAVLILITAAIFQSCAKSEDKVKDEVSLTGDSIRGGRLYDKWWSVLKVESPENNQALWSTQTNNIRSGADTWRCKECHGWDYKGEEGAYGSGSHFTGFVGVSDAAKKGGGYVLGALKGETSSSHDFSTVMDDQSLIDLALFITELAIDYNQFIDSNKNAIGGNVSDGKKLFEDTCVKCHGYDGAAMNFKNQAGPEYLGGLSQDNPWEFMHKLRVGQPGEWHEEHDHDEEVEQESGTGMPSVLEEDWSDEDQVSILAYVQTLPTTNPVVEGGILYDKWWAALGLDKPVDDQFLWSTQSTNTRSGADTWRCKECHGWDYKGAEGAYGSGSHFTGFTGILNASSMSADKIAGWLNGSENEDHDFSAFFGKDQIDMMTAFLQEGISDISPYVNSDKTVNGDPVNGGKLWEASCQRCHGEDGLEINFGSAEDTEYIGTVASGNPWEFFHKASFGQPGEHMPSGRSLGFSPQDRADIISFTRDMPITK